jgi:hypothetical protein
MTSIDTSRNSLNTFRRSLNDKMKQIEIKVNAAFTTKHKIPPPYKERRDLNFI